MIIDIVLGYNIIEVKWENELIRLIQYMQQEGWRARVFQGYSSQYQEWMQQIPEIYYYVHKTYQDEEDYISYGMGYKEKVERLGAPDIVIATQHLLMCCICKLGISFLGSHQPAILFWPWKELSLNGEQSWLSFMDACIVTHHEIGQSITACVHGEQVVYLLEENMDTLEGRLALKHILMKYYYTKKSESYEFRSKN